MSVGFVMLAHAALDRAAQIAIHLAEAGYPLVVHIDSRTDDLAFEKFAAQVEPFDNVHLAQRTACEWGTWSLVQVSRDAAETLLNDYPDLHHVMLISGSCVPIKPIGALEAFLASHRDTDFIESVTIGDVPWTKAGLSDERFTLTFPFAWKRHKRLFDIWVDLQRRVGRKRTMPDGLQPHMGSQWWCLSRSTLMRILHDTRRGALDRFFQKVWIPDESYFQSLVRLYGSQVESRSLTLSKFDFQGKPHVFYDDHLLLLRQSPAFFARKIWPGANRLYRVFLSGRLSRDSRSSVSAAHVDRTFAQAITRRTRGRAGLVMAGRDPNEGFENGITAAPYAVFHGFSDVFRDFPRWVSKATGSRAHGHLFDAKRVEFYGGQSGYAGALSDSAKLRDYDAGSFLRNLIWNTRGEHQSFLFSPRDTQDVAEFLAADRNANISVISGAWALPLLRSGKPIAEVRRTAALLQMKEAAFLELLHARDARCRARIWSLAEFLERPLDTMQDIVDSMSGAESHLVTECPEMKSMNGLIAFLQALRNAGMNPHLAGDVMEPELTETEDTHWAIRPSR
ncbi:MAG: glycosyl transferase [Silicimonas sp.]|nr:glycosyl transferase [Silicimonas sp.]